MAALRSFSAAEVLVRREDVPALIELARTTREVRGPGSQYVKQYVLQTLSSNAGTATGACSPFVSSASR